MNIAKLIIIAEYITTMAALAVILHCVERRRKIERQQRRARRLREHAKARIAEIEEAEPAETIRIANEFAAECHRNAPIRKVCGVLAGPQAQALLK